MFIAALFIVTKTLKQPKYPPIDKWKKEMYIPHIMEYFLFSHKKEWNNVICSHMDRPREHHTEWSKSRRDRQISYAITYMCILNDANKCIYKTEIDS